MKILVIVRPGDNRGNMLTEKGVRDIQNLSGSLLDCIKGMTLAIQSSDVGRARYTAQILAADMGCKDTRLHEFLYSDDDSPPRHEKLIAMLAAADTEAVIVVTHYEWANQFPAHFFHTKGWVIPGGRMPSMQKGDAVVIDCDTRTFRKITPPSS